MLLYIGFTSISILDSGVLWWRLLHTLLRSQCPKTILDRNPAGPFVSLVFKLSRLASADPGPRNALLAKHLSRKAALCAAQLVLGLCGTVLLFYVPIAVACGESSSIAFVTVSPTQAPIYACKELPGMFCLGLRTNHGLRRSQQPCGRGNRGLV